MHVTFFAFTLLIVWDSVYQKHVEHIAVIIECRISCSVIIICRETCILMLDLWTNGSFCLKVNWRGFSNVPWKVHCLLIQCQKIRLVGMNVLWKWGEKLRLVTVLPKKDWAGMMPGTSFDGVHCCRCAGYDAQWRLASKCPAGKWWQPIAVFINFDKIGTWGPKCAFFSSS